MSMTKIFITLSLRTVWYQYWNNRKFRIYTSWKIFRATWLSNLIPTTGAFCIEVKITFTFLLGGLRLWQGDLTLMTRNVRLLVYTCNLI